MLSLIVNTVMRQSLTRTIAQRSCDRVLLAVDENSFSDHHYAQLPKLTDKAVCTVTLVNSSAASFAVSASASLCLVPRTAL